MQAKFTLIAALAAMASAAVTGERGRFGCGTHDPSPEHIEISKKLAEEEAANATSGNFRLAAAATINVPTYFHVVASSQTVANGYITTTRTVNPTWAQDGNELAMKSALRKGNYGALNLYFLREVGGDFGYCYFPTTAAAGSTAYIRDGCTILSSTVPGGSETNYNLGKTVVHEVGHWFGLYHTFQGACTGTGDSIADTPAQASYSTGCPTGRDSCPSQAGLDPIHNYMDYSYDSCYEEFTPNQQTRMYSFWNQYRA
ncbi:metalloprotease 1 [Colletotrichum tofieldiae]|nr:metalloprotease 1 [Colletotrichum tofieldiae]